MALAARGYIKLLEEAGEAQQVIAKLLAYWGHDNHPDGQKLIPRIEAEIADLLAAIDITLELNQLGSQLTTYPDGRPLGLNLDKIERRRKRKLSLFRKWAREPQMDWVQSPLPPPPTAHYELVEHQFPTKKTKKKGKKK